MTIHDWTRVPAGIFHAFHHAWIQSLSNSLNGGILPQDYYALREQLAGGLGPDVLTPQAKSARSEIDQGHGGAAVTLLTPPRTRFTAESELDFYRRKKSSVVIRHVSGDEIVAIVEIVSPGNKSSRRQFRAFLDKVYQLLEARVHLLIIDPFPPGPRDPDGVHAAIWEDDDLDGSGVFHLPPDKPLTLVAYACGLTTRAYVEPVGVGDVLPDMPLFLEPNGCVSAPLESTYQAAFAVQPTRWRSVLEPPSE
jgi:hypothetical protein